ncbi:DUF805 domain-containing protein [Sphingomonas lacunae]|uniref:DUF805 domain-containing protein n=1 Tax=Sphingomonas lacunae TaxID=2698828 RepID=A0A6M4AQ10_9SPHN|nr:DUF805 domain-containing protein [Sphingomonas lacunae]QJQ31153.1 DUF805 domain-containing protein [Sphingomonas lacunae]
MATYCSQCGSPTASSDTFCPSCGKALPKAGAFGQQSAASTAPSPVAPATANIAYGQPYGAADQQARPANLSTFQWMLLPFKRYADFSGRSRRQEYWMFYLLNWIVWIICAALILVAMPWSAWINDVPGATPSAGLWVGLALLAIWVVVSFIPNIAVVVRRLHDQNLTGWLFFAFVLGDLFIGLGWVARIVLMCIDGTPGPNQYGPDPKGRGLGEVFA